MPEVKFERGEKVNFEPAQSIIMQRPGGGGGREGQTGTPTPPPIYGHSGPDQINGGEWMDTSANLSPNGACTTTTHTWTTNAFYGFTGGNIVIFVGQSANVIGSLPLRTFGVDGTWIPFKTSNRYDTANDNVGANIYANCHGIQVINKYTPINRLQQDLQQAASILQQAVQVGAAIGTVIAAIAAL